MNTFAIIGVAGYVAPKHLDAIKYNNGKLLAGIDPNDNVELLDDFFPECEFYKDMASFEQYLSQNMIDYVVICSPTHLHFEHIKLALNNQCHVICESPVVLTSNELREVESLEKQNGKKVFSILQLRYHPAVTQLKTFAASPSKSNIKLTYHTFRGKWFSKSWKGDKSKSGGVLTSLGYHFFDLLMTVFGEAINFSVTELSEHTASGKLMLEKANVEFDLRNQIASKNDIKRELRIENSTIDLQRTGKDEFRKCYKDIIDNKGLTSNNLSPIIKILSNQ
jgi:UDP-N-acetyl-2-amino-2-deoxyglucuronate dehydrogenase